jgi:diguanylate cyclase (GGDEF)-like protein
MADIQAHFTGKTPNLFNEHRGQCKDGSWKWVLCRGAIVSRNAEGKPLRMIGTHVDITGKKQTEEALLVSARFQQAVFDSLSAPIAVLDRYGTVIQTNAAWWKYAIESGLAETHCFRVGNYLEILNCLCGKDQDTVLAAQAGIASVVSGEVTQFQLQHPFFTPLDKRWFIMKVTPVHDVDERIVVSHEDVTKLKAAELASLTLANIDTLTGALSRRNFLNLAEQELARSNRYQLPLMLLMLDLDHFKLINDRHGHAAGDAVLHGFVQTVTAVLRESDLIGRIGGEEFAVLLPNTTHEGGRALAQRIIDSVRGSPVEVGGQRIPYTVSIGAGCLSSETSFAALLGVADAALYRAKNGGRDRLELAST